jgi:hypothetical protein
MSEMPEVGGRAPITVDVEAGKSYWWCACGRSKKQPFCDGSHKARILTDRIQGRCGQRFTCACKRSGETDLRRTHKTLTT